MHPSTVSRALDPARAKLVNPETREKVAAVAAQLGYQPHLIASQLRRGQTRTVGVVIPDMANPLFAPFVRGVMNALDRNGYMPLIAVSEDDHQRFRQVLRHMASRRVDAIITAAARTGDARVLQEVAARGLPIILAIRTLPKTNFPAVCHDDAAGAALAARHLIELGHRRLAQLKGPPDVGPFAARDRGFTDEAAASGVLVQDSGMFAERPTAEEGRRLTDALLALSGPRPTAIFAQNDMVALGALDALRATGLRCPEDVSIVGYNDMFFAAHGPVALTTVRFPAYEIGRLAGSMAHEHVEDPSVAWTAVSASPALVVRDSTAPPAGE